MASKVKVLLVGETWMTLKINIKGIDMFPVGGYENFGIWFMEAMAKVSRCPGRAHAQPRCPRIFSFRR